MKLSIVVPSYNQGKYLEEALLSVISQHRNDVELIVMDGGSTDNSVEIIKKYRNNIAYWQSKKDKGQSDAINEGFRIAKGEYVTWLNSDDILVNGALDLIIATIDRNPHIKWFLGNLLWIDKSGRIIKVGKVEKACWFWNRFFLFSNGGPSAIMKRETLLGIGGLREDFHYMMDTELWCRFISIGEKFVRIEDYCWGLRLHESAKMSGHNFKNSVLADKNHPSWTQKKKEAKYISDKYKVSFLLNYIWRFSKLFTFEYYTRFFENHKLGKKIDEIRV